MSTFLDFCVEQRICYISENDTILFKASDIGRFLALKHVHTSLANFPKDETVLLKKDSNGGPQKTLMLTAEGLRRLVCKSRSSKADILAKEIGMEIHSNRFTPQETETMIFLKKSFVGIDMVPQYSCGPYRIDMYLPGYKLAIECDEGSHCGNRLLMDKSREVFIVDKLGCKFIRYRPGDSDFDLATVVGQCFKWIFDHT